MQIGDFNNAEAYKINLPGQYNIEQLRLGQFGNGACGLELVNHSDASNSYGVRLISNVDNGGYALQIQTANPTNAYQSLNYTTRLAINVNGNVGIGTINPQNKLDVNGTIHAKEVKVDLTGWSDFVFAPTYRLRPLSEVEKYVKANNHLPEIPSASEIQQNGLSLGDMQNKLLQKVEELTLYTIEQDKRLRAQDQKLIDQEKKNAKLLQQINDLKELINQKLK